MRFVWLYVGVVTGVCEVCVVTGVCQVCVRCV